MEMTAANGQFLGMVGISALVFIALSVGAVIASFIAAVSGTAGGLALLAFMAFVFPPALLIPIHTVVQLGAAASLGISRRKYMMWETALPFLIGTAVGAVAGGQIFVNLPESVLLMTLAISILVLVWVPVWLLPQLPKKVPEKGWHPTLP